jgi:hypothetical protein
MNFAFNLQTQRWEADIEFQGVTVCVALDESFSETDLESIAAGALERISLAWPQIEGNIVDSLHTTYNESWADPAHGASMTREDFLARTRFESLEVDDRRSLTLYFSESGLFGGHWIEIFWNAAGRMYPANITA